MVTKSASSRGVERHQRLGLAGCGAVTRLFPGPPRSPCEPGCAQTWFWLRPDEGEDNRPALRKESARLAKAGCGVRRVRVVEKPFPAYLLWEPHSLRVRAQRGEDIRVISPGRLASFERDRPVPEVVTLGDEVTYRSSTTRRAYSKGRSDSLTLPSPHSTGRK
ncbi:DUF6879 family protein [Nocardiopsis synnemataformans]|uniref:DUF6879 family protein n=1 Tax=Nocardiopsis synnemataformans TaxID=61305 RepID=UPI003EBFD845